MRGLPHQGRAEEEATGGGLGDLADNPPALLHFLGELAYGLLGNNAPIATGERGLSLVDGGENLRAGTLAFFPQSKGFLHRIFFAPQSTALNSLADKRLLV